MTSKTYDTGVILARATSKSKKLDVWSYSMSDGNTLRMGSDNLELGSWYFVEVYKDAFEVSHYVSHSALSTSDAEGLADEIRDMQIATLDVVKVWNHLCKADRIILLRDLGIGLTALGAVSATASGISSLFFAESVLGALTGGASIVLGAGLGIVSYLQLEERKEALLLHKAALKKYMDRKNIVARMMLRHMPTKYVYLPCYDPAITSIVTRTKVMIKNFDFNEFLNFGSNENLDFNLA